MDSVGQFFLHALYFLSSLTFVLVTSVKRAEGSRERSVDSAVNSDLSCSATGLTLKEKRIHYI